MFNITQKLILDQNHEIPNVSAIEWHFILWMRSTLLRDEVIKLAKAKVYVYSDSVLCLGKMQEHSEADERWKDHTQYFQHSNEHKAYFGITGEPIEVEWNIIPGHRTLQILQEIQDNKAACQTSPEEFEDRIIFMSMFNDIDWTQKRNSTECFSNSGKGQELPKKVPAWTLVIPRSRRRRNGMEHTMTNLKESGILLPMSR